MKKVLPRIKGRKAFGTKVKILTVWQQLAFYTNTRSCKIKSNCQNVKLLITKQKKKGSIQMRGKVNRKAGRGLKKKAVLVKAMTMAILSVSFVGKAATDNNVDFSFKVGAYHENGRVKNKDARYRSATNEDNAWKVKMTDSREGSGSVTKFWIELYDGTNVSDTVSATQGNSEYYKSATSQASKATVYLTAENNNYNGTSYWVSGVWDEETGVILK